MKAKCIKADPLGWVEVGREYDITEYKEAYGVISGGIVVFGISKENFAEHFEMEDDKCGSKEADGRR